jgi:hypothetical protein
MGEAMLKISLVENARSRRVIVEGKLIAPWAAELRSACEKAKADLRGRELVIEMKHVMKISPEGGNVILELNAECLIQSWEAVNQSGFPHLTVIPQNSGRAAILSRFTSRN